MIVGRYPEWNDLNGRSHCPFCNRTITWVENIPIFSYVFLGGRCRGCKERISIRYPVLEGLTAMLFALAAAKFGLSLRAAIYAAFFWVLVVLTFIDLEHKRLPNKITLPTFFIGIPLVVLDALSRGEPRDLIGALLGVAIFGGFFELVAWIKPAGMGGGDVRLAYSLGLFLGYLGGAPVTLVGMFLSFFSGGLIGLLLIAVAKGDRKTQVPFGPFLALGTVLGIFLGQSIADL
ncbi:MAG: prepilin peptidase, partial [Actinobacteria bacterium]|nr:prepilin peptidase [Actinomycetota bacterium]